jgi:hypothetical protein
MYLQYSPSYRILGSFVHSNKGQSRLDVGTAKSLVRGSVYVTISDKGVSCSLSNNSTASNNDNAVDYYVAKKENQRDKTKDQDLYWV